MWQNVTHNKSSHDDAKCLFHECVCIMITHLLSPSEWVWRVSLPLSPNVILAPVDKSLGSWRCRFTEQDWERDSWLTISYSLHSLASGAHVCHALSRLSLTADYTLAWTCTVSSSQWFHFFLLFFTIVVCKLTNSMPRDNSCSHFFAFFLHLASSERKYLLLYRFADQITCVPIASAFHTIFSSPQTFQFL